MTGSDIPTLKQLLEFIAHKCQVLEATGKPSAGARSKSNVEQAACHAVLKFKYSYCSGDHSIYRCKDFLALTVARRISEIRTRKLCANCLRSTAHVANKCTSNPCKSCKAKHNTLLYAKTESESREGNNGEKKTASVTTANVTTQPSAVVMHSSSSNDKQVMLSIALVYVDDHEGTPKECRVLLDCGSQANFVSKKFLNLLALKPHSSNTSISGINGTVTESSQVVHLRLQSRLNAYSANIVCVVAD